ncbi:OLC1v1005803C1 [Oldenlandia corymbosa var. corymbosa]|uniref:feruloyl-CoA 6-hydroxylase n=1 Tax=Oldenlandia corymbosa var. corymbosa TaxID=529605 RepID=A0AAV1DFJ0_OLDCO|nr:OLC1v1005803C1 [Oldenlandia corymbosa var. corymbosa]
MSPTFDDTNTLFDFVVRNGNGVKGLVDSGIKNVPEKYIQPSSERINKIVGSQNSSSGLQQCISPIDLSLLDGPNHDEVVKAIVNASERIGFFQVVNHGIPADLLESLKQAAHQFFTQPPDEKAIYLPGEGRSRLVKYGTSFSPEKEKALEWKDYLNMVYTNDAEALEHWPNQCKEVALRYLKSSYKIVKKLLEILFENLGEKLEDSRLDSLTGRKLVNMLFYPPCPNPDLTVGVGRHSDIGTLTVLLQDSIGGLHVKVEEDVVSGQKEEWIEIPPFPNALVINIGDALQIISNGRYISAEHRVRTTSKGSRVSIPFFTIPTPTEKIGPLPQVIKHDGVARYREVLYQEYMNNYFGKAHDGKKSLDFARIN